MAQLLIDTGKTMVGVDPSLEPSAVPAARASAAEFANSINSAQEPEFREVTSAFAD
jgi:hypothetical protein